MTVWNKSIIYNSAENPVDQNPQSGTVSGDGGDYSFKVSDILKKQTPDWSKSSSIQILNSTADGTVTYRICRAQEIEVPFNTPRKVNEFANSYGLNFHCLSNGTCCLSAVDDHGEHQSTCFQTPKTVKILSPEKKECKTESLDLEPPQITDPHFSVNDDVVTVYATVSDHGKPLQDLTTGIQAGVHSWFRFDSRPGEDMPEIKVTSNFNPNSGILSGTFRLPKTTDDIFGVVFKATDKAGNEGSLPYDLTIPRFPPEVSLELIEASAFQITGGGNVNLLGTARDYSGIDPDKTICTIDDTPYPPSPLFDTSALQEILAGDVYSTTLHYPAYVEEGKYLATFSASDNIGLTASTALNFEIKYPPRIENFTVTNLTEVSGNTKNQALSAIIYDQGNDLDLAGIRLLIDNQEVPAGLYSFSDETGEFTTELVSGLLAGLHSAKLSATDAHGNTTTEELRFIIGSNLATTTDLNQALFIDTVQLWELRNTNGDGEANPGEFVRMLISLANSAEAELNGCRAELVAEDRGLRVETRPTSTFSIPAGEPSYPLPGFDLNIDKDILTGISSDPYRTHLRLGVTCSENSWEFPLELPIFVPSTPIDVYGMVTIDFTNLPRAINDASVELRGTVTSSSSYPESLTIWINGQALEPVKRFAEDGGFSVTVPLVSGLNTIEAEAIDKSGETGWRTATIYRKDSLAIDLDRVPSSVSAAQLTIQGEIISSLGTIDRITLMVNGEEQPLSLREKDLSFKTEIALAVGNNLIELEVYDTSGNRATKSVRVNRSGGTGGGGIVTPPSATIEITSPANGEVIPQCSTLMIEGTFDTQGAELEAVEVDTSFACNRNVDISGSDFMKHCYGYPLEIPGTYSIQATLKTKDGKSVTRTIVIAVSDRGGC